MKRQNWLNTSLGAVPGALPPVGGWTAATGAIDPGAVVLFLILFAWQHPHFYAIAWIFRDDYRRGGFKMLPVVEPRWEQHLLAGDGLLGTAADLFGVAFVYGAYWAVLPSWGPGYWARCFWPLVSRLASRAR